MILYLDTSALVKLYIAESGRGAVQSAASKAKALATHAIAYVEFHATLARLLREQRVDETGLRELQSAFSRDWMAFVIIDVAEALLIRAADLTYRYALRGYDSVHLAAAEVLLRNQQQHVVFACFDARLNSAAQAAGLELLTDNS